MKIRYFSIAIILVLLVFLFGSTVFIGAYDKTYTVYMVGQGHQDTGWTWDWPSTISQITSTINTQLTSMNNNSDFRFTYPAMQHYKFLSEYDQTMFNSVKQRITEGRWEVAGGQWVEPDANLTWGESATRQFLIGKRYARSILGVDPKMGYLPDTFGHPHTMPQILSKSGMDCFVFTKFSGSWGYLSNWSAPDGTSILLINSDSYNADPASVDYNGQINKVTPYGLKIAMRTYGNGDQGGGPNQAMVDSIHSKDTTSGIPAVKCKTLLDFYNDIKNNLSSIGSWNDELYYASGQGIYSNNAAGKYLLRKNDVKIEQTEKFGYIAKWLGATGYQTDKFNNAWNVTLCNEFHDHIYGTHSCNAIVNREIDMYGVSSNLLDNTMNYSLDAISKRADTNVGSGSVPVIVFNPLSWARNDLVETSVTFTSAPTSVRVYDYQTGAEVPAQVLSINGNTAKILFEANNVPGIGYKVFKATAAGAGSYSTGLSIGSNIIENNFIRATISSSTGNFSSVYLKGANWEAVGSGKQANELHLLVDTDVARNLIQSEMEATPTLLNTPQSISVIESGPVRAVYRVTKKTAAGSTIVQDITMYSNTDRVDVKNSVDWNEQHKMLKAAFNLNVNVTKCTYEIPYGNVERVVTDSAKFEVPAHKWADMTSGGYGVSILNDSKYGWDDTSNRIRLSLLRSPNANATGYEVGHYDYTYSIYPHSGDWKTANTVKEANELNYPLIAAPTTQHTGVLGNTFSFASVDQPNVMITAIKKAEDSPDDLVIRLVEVNGVASTNCNVTFAGNITNARKINLIEDDQGAQTYSGNQLNVSVGKYGIYSFRVTVSSPNYSDTKPTSNIVSLSASYNLDGITQNSARTSGNIDGSGNSLPAELMPATVIGEDIQFNLAGSEGNNMVQCTGQTVTLPQGNYQSLQVLALAAGGANVESGSFQVNYTDSTNSSAVLGIRDWTTKALTWGSSVIADNIATYVTHRHTSTSDDKCKWVYLFKYAIALDSAKTTSSIVLPNNTKIKILAMTLSNQVIGPTSTPAPTPTPTPTPTPGGDLCNGGTPSASAVQTGQTAAEAFDDNFTTSKWIAAATTAWIQYQFGGGNAYVVTSYTLTSGNDLPGRDPKNWQFQGSNNGTTWTTLDTRTGVTFASRLLTQSFSFTNTTAYNYYRINITLNNGDAKTCLEEVEMLGGSLATPTPTPTPTVGPTATPTPTPAATPTSTPSATSTPTPTPGGQVIVNLTSSFNEDAFSYDTNRANGNYDGLGASYPAEQTTTNPTFESAQYQIGPLTDGSNNAILGTGQVINLPQGQYSSIRFLGAATNGNQTGTFRITYTDSTYTDVSVTQLDWRTLSSVANEKVVEIMTHKHTPSGDSATKNTYIFGYYLTPTAGKTVMSLTLPNSTGMHVLAITLVP